MILSVKELSKKYQQGQVEVQALKDIHIELKKGETLSIVGPSGSGKTTLLSLLAGLDSPSFGQIELIGSNLTQMNEKQLSEFRAKTIGIIFQQFHLMPYLSAFENVCLPLEINKEKNIEERAIKCLEQVDLKNRARHRPDQLSGGECQRVAIARALVIEPKILLADEPSGNLDSETGSRVMDLLFKLVDSHAMTMVLVTHNPEHANRCQRSLQLKGGQMQ